MCTECDRIGWLDDYEHEFNKWVRGLGWGNSNPIISLKSDLDVSTPMRYYAKPFCFTCANVVYYEKDCLEKGHDIDEAPRFI